MKKIKIGDYFEIKTTEGRILFQYLQRYKTYGDLIRILPDCFSIEEDNAESILESHQDELLIIPLKKAYKQGMINLVGNKRIPRSLILSHQMKSIKIDNNEGLISYRRIDYDAWYKKNKKELSDDEKNFLFREQGML